MTRDVSSIESILSIRPLGHPWQAPDPFLVCVHHVDGYPAGNDRLGPAAPLSGRDLGQDFSAKDGWSMYHGLEVPGFPQHPHRGFETVTVVRKGFVDHSDSAGATARYGGGDVQWLTAGRGINHSEMFPLVRPDASNELELFQIWLNLPRATKLVEPHFTMFWNENVPRVERPGVQVTLVAGAVEETTPLAPPPASWASNDASDLAIWTVKLAANGRWTLPAARVGTNRTLFFFAGRELKVDGRTIPAKHSIDLRADREIELEAGADEVELLVLQGRPIGEPVVQYGPFVMTTRDEIVDTVREYQRTRFGGWPWDGDAPVHPREAGRFAKHPDGRLDVPSRDDGRAEQGGRLV